MTRRPKHSRTRRSPTTRGLDRAPSRSSEPREAAGADDDLDDPWESEDDLDGESSGVPDEYVEVSFQSARPERAAKALDEVESSDLDRSESRWRDATFYALFLGLTVALALIEMAVLARGLGGAGG